MKRDTVARWAHVLLAAGVGLACSPADPPAPAARVEPVREPSTPVETSRVTPDRAAAHTERALVHAARGESAQADTEFRAALALDADDSRARIGLAQSLHGAKRSAEAEALLREGLARTPASGELRHALGLLLNELGRATEAANELIRATQLLPDDGDKALDAAYVLEGAGRDAEAEQMLVHATVIAPRSLAVLATVAQHFADREQWLRALPCAEQLARLQPADEEVKAFVEHVRAQAAHAQH